MTLRLCLFSVLAAFAAAPVFALPLSDFRDDAEERELRDAEEELKTIEKRISLKEIPPIEFEFNSAKLREHSKNTLELVADLLFRHPRFKLYISGHTCDIGSDEYNLWLSQKRAESVKDYLVSLGVLGEFIRAKGYGESSPLLPNDDEENRSQNRRVEFRIVTRWWNSVY